MELSEYVPVNLICLAVLGALGLRKLIRMESHHWLRVALLTAFLWALALYLFTAAFSSAYPGCPPSYEGPDGFTIMV